MVIAVSRLVQSSLYVPSVVRRHLRLFSFQETAVIEWTWVNGLLYIRCPETDPKPPVLR